MDGERFQPVFYGYAAEFTTPEALVRAAGRVRAAGYRRFDAFTPMPVHGLAEALGVHRTEMPRIVLLGGFLGLIGGFALLYWMTVISYPHNVGGRPYFSWPSYIPVVFETTVLTAALFGVLGMIALNKLPMPYHPMFNVPAFLRASQDRFFLLIEARDTHFDRDRTRELLEELEPAEVHLVED